MAKNPPAPLDDFRGRRVRARTIGGDFDEDDPDDYVEPEDVEGFLAVEYVVDVDYWRCSVAGRSVEPDSITLVD